MFLKTTFVARVGWIFLLMVMVKNTLWTMEKTMLISATALDRGTVEVKVQKTLKPSDINKITITPELTILDASVVDHRIVLKTETLDLTRAYSIAHGDETVEVVLDSILDNIYSTKELGCRWNEHQTTFRLFAPRASQVTLVLFQNVLETKGVEYAMNRDEDGVWENVLDGHYFGQYYAYRIDGSHSIGENVDPSRYVADPYSLAVATQNDYVHQGKTLILDTSSYDWEDDNWTNICPNDLIIYECHLRDMTAHRSSGAPSDLAGSYPAFIRPGIRGGLEHIKSLGVNAVEFLPVHEFANIEIPFGVPVGEITNTWNPYARNHWGYMTSYFFAPESYYASDQKLTPDEWIGGDGRQINEFKNVVKALHKAGIAVILDVVYNHVSQYDQNPFKLIDKKYYFRLNDDQSYCSASGCGNDFKTERPMARRLIIDSIRYWMEEYHVDGFRFDLASMIDWTTCDEILKEARKINPNVILIAEPWGGGKYTPAEFSRHGWAAWNDQIRNGVKGQNPHDGHSFIFGKWFADNDLDHMKAYVSGTLVSDGGLFQSSGHAINYLESHDDNTLGDFIRIALGLSGKVGNIEKNAKLTKDQLKLNRLGALFLFTSQGAVMIHEGQEWARSKVIAPSDAPDQNVGFIDHNSYNKDNETNWLNFHHADLNHELVDYYRGLIKLRNAYSAFRRSQSADIKFFDNNKNPFALAYVVTDPTDGDSGSFFVALNANRKLAANFTLPAGEWNVLVDSKRAGTDPLFAILGSIYLPPSTGAVLRKK